MDDILIVGEDQILTSIEFLDAQATHYKKVDAMVQSLHDRVGKAARKKKYWRTLVSCMKIMRSDLRDAQMEVEECGAEMRALGIDLAPIKTAAEEIEGTPELILRDSGWWGRYENLPTLEQLGFVKYVKPGSTQVLETVTGAPVTGVNNAS